MAKWIGWLLAGLWVYAQVPCEAQYEIAGYVEWFGAEVEILPGRRRAQVDSLGYFHLHGVCAGSYTVRVWFEGHIVAEAAVQVPQTVPLVIEGKEKLHTVLIEGHVPQAQHVEPLRTLVQPELGLAMQLAQVPGVAVSQAGPFIAKPIIEGLRGTRIAYWQGGQPLASQQWGEDHAPEIDPFSSEELEVRVGASPVRHGTEAVGGAIIAPVPSVCCLRENQGRFFLSGILNGYGGVAGLRLQGTAFRWGYRLQGTWLTVGTLRTPRYYLTGTGTQQFHGSFTAHRLWTRWQVRLYYAQYNAQIGIFQGMHTGNLSDLQAAIQLPVPRVQSEFSYQRTPPYQSVTHELLTLSASYLAPDEGIWTLTFGRQFNRRQERDLVGIYTGGTGIALDLQLTSYFFQATYERGRWYGGAFLQYQRNYRQYAYFIPTYTRWQGGAFLIYKAPKWEGGFRIEPMHYDFKQVVLRTGGMPIEEIKRTFFPMAAEMRYTGKVLIQLSALTRAPNPAELYAYGLHQAQAAFHIGGNDFRIEPTLGGRVAWEKERLAGGVGVYYSPAFIWQRLGEPVLSLRGASLSMQYKQSPVAWLSLSARWTERLSSYFTWEVRGAYLWGNVYAESTLPMPLLPPLVLTPVVRFRYGYWAGEVYWQQQFRQHRYALEAEYLPPPAGYGLLGVQVAWERKGWRISLSGENLLNRAYRAYPDLMRFFADQIGRQVRLTVGYDFAL